MKRYNIDFKYTPFFIEECIYSCLSTRWKRRDVSYFFAEYVLAHNYNVKVDKHLIALRIHNLLKEGKKKEFRKLVRIISYDMYEEINGRYVSFKPIWYQDRYDPCSKKVRKIGISEIKQQIYDYIAVESCKNMFMSKIYKYQCASLKDRGQSYGVNAISKWIRTNPHKTKYAFKCDIKKYYPSVDRNRLKELLRRDIKNDDILYVVFTLIDTYDKGLCIGSYLSQYLANYYLSYACHYIMENMYTIRKSRRSNEVAKINLVTHTLFYMDDIIMFSSNKKYLSKASKMLEEYLNSFLKLQLKDKKELFFVSNRGIDMMGYVIYRDHTEIRRSIFLRMRKLFIKYKDKRKKMSVNDARAILSYKGYLDHSSSNKFNKKYKTSRTIKIAKGIVSEYDSRIYRGTTTV